MTMGARPMRIMKTAARRGGEDEAVQKPAVGFVESSCSVGLRDVGVEAEEDSGDAEAESVVEDLSEGRGGDG